MFEVFEKKHIDNQDSEDFFFLNIGDSHKNDKQIVWFDLHVSADGYKLPDPFGKETWEAFEKPKNGGARFIKVDRGDSVTLQTAEIIRTGQDLTGIVVASAGCSVKGLSTTSGKVDPNFGPQNLALSVRNVSNQTIWIKEGDKIAVIGFCRTNAKVNNMKIKGPAQAAADLLPSWLNRAIAHTKALIGKYKKLSLLVVVFYIFSALTQAQFRAIADSTVNFIKATISQSSNKT